MIGVNRTAIAEIESGKRSVKAEELKRFCELFQMSADELLYGIRHQSLIWYLLEALVSCLVAFELKIGEFKPEYIGKINLYLEALDREVKKENLKMMRL